VPDAYWWQLVDRTLASRLSEDVVQQPVSDSLIEIVFGSATDWTAAVEAQHGERDQPLVFGTARAALMPLLSGY
jgi:hypothetical protein